MDDSLQCEVVCAPHISSHEREAAKSFYSEAFSLGALVPS